MCNKAVDTYPFVFDSVLVRYKTQEMYDKVASEESSMLKYCLDRYKAKEMCNKSVDASLPALKFGTDWFVTNKILKKLTNALFSSSLC